MSVTSSLAQEWIASPRGNRGAFMIFFEECVEFLNLSGS